MGVAYHIYVTSKESVQVCRLPSLAVLGRPICGANELTAVGSSLELEWRGGKQISTPPPPPHIDRASFLMASASMPS